MTICNQCGKELYQAGHVCSPYRVQNYPQMQMQRDAAIGPRVNMSGMILSSYEAYNYCVSRYPGRIVEASAYTDPAVDFYYWNRKNEMRMVRKRTEIWILDLDWPGTRRRR